MRRDSIDFNLRTIDFTRKTRDQIMTDSILLIGKNGQVGTELLALLPRVGNLTAFDRQQFDLNDSELIRRAVRQVRPGIIVNAAAYTAVDRAEGESEVAYAVNATAPAVLAEEAKQLGSVLVHYSTDYVFDGSKRIPYEERDSTNPLSIYGKSKLAGEEAIRASGVVHLIFRISWVYATRGQNFLLTLLRLAAQREELRMVHDQFGSPNWARDIARATTSVLQSCLRGSSLSSSFEAVAGTYHMSTTGATTRFDFAGAILDELRRSSIVPEWASAAAGVRPLVLRRLIPITSAEFPTPATRPLYSVLSSARLSQVFGIQLPEWRSQLRSIFAESSTEI